MQSFNRSISLSPRRTNLASLPVVEIFWTNCFIVLTNTFLRNFFLTAWFRKVVHFFFLSGFSFTNIHESQDSLHEHLDISRAITAESSPLHIASSRTRKSLTTKLSALKVVDCFGFLL